MEMIKMNSDIFTKRMIIIPLETIGYIDEASISNGGRKECLVKEIHATIYNRNRFKEYYEALFDQIIYYKCDYYICIKIYEVSEQGRIIAILKQDHRYSQYIGDPEYYRKLQLENKEKQENASIR